MKNLIITSSDGHAVIPPKLWAEYLEKPYHKYLTRLHEDRDLFSGSMAILGGMRTPDHERPVFDAEGVFDEGQWGLWDHDVRIAQMDREGVAAELCIPGDFRAIDLFWNTTNACYSIKAMDAGARAFNRWSVDTFGKSSDRLLMVGAPMAGIDMDAALAEAAYLAEQGFPCVYTPGYCAVPSQVPVYETYWDKLFATFAEAGITLVTHAGYGMPQGYMHSEVEACAAENRAAQGDGQTLARRLLEGVFNDHGVFSDLRSRQSLWLFTLGGVFDRHPDLKMMVTEVRADWMPDTIKLVDRVWEQNRDRLPCKRRPSEYLGTNMMFGLSFMKRSEIEHRHEIGVGNMAFGRDYPHTESVWPNTAAYFGEVFEGVPEEETRAIIGENMARFLGLDIDRLAEVAARIGAPSFAELQARGPMPEALKKHLNIRCGYSEGWEGDRRLPDLEKMLQTDIPRLAAAATAFEPA